ncbi:MAG TPA: AsmA family protein [Xanthobacteraceae bacterium]|nr:AsmA family protein [Xanthobacteraceae bacterium]
MQATLLGVSIAIILALVAALVGPLFIDWTQYRSAFEAEASRMVGAPVRVAGAIDVRVLPTPSLMLRGVEVGEARGEPRLKARELDIELALGPLVRGVFRAADMRLVGPDFRLGLDASGQMVWPLAQAGVDPDQWSIDRLAIEDGRAVLADARSGARIVLDKFWFNGELRSLAGPVKGEGGFSADGERYGYRVAAGRVDDGAMKLRLTLDPSEHALTVEADGTLRLDTSAPGFEGTLTLARPAGIGSDKGRGVASVPWRATGKVKATAASALFEQVEFQYGPEERAIRLAGVADIRFGKSPRLTGVLSAREVDLDRAFDLPDEVRRQPIAAVRTIAESVGGTIRPPFPAQLGIGVDSVTLAGGTLQALRGDFRSDATGIDVETFEFRAPGSTQVRVSGRIGLSGRDATFNGPAAVEASDPQAFAAWLEGRASSRQPIGPLRASGEVSLGAERIAIERLKAEVDRKAIEGRLLYAWATGSGAPRLEADIKAAELDIDRLIALGRTALGGATPDLPGETVLAVEVGRATIAGVEARNATVKLRLDAAGLVLDRVAFGDLGGAAINLAGRIEGPLSAPQGAVSFDLDARSLDGSLALIAKFAPDAAETARRMAPLLVPLKTRATLTLAHDAGPSRFTIEGTAGGTRVRLAAQANGDPFAPDALDVRIDGDAWADYGAVLVQLLGLDRAVAVDKQPGRLTLSAQGPLNGDLRVDAKLATGGFAATANGTARLFGDDGARGTFDITASAADVPLLRRGGANAPGQQLPVGVKARLTAARNLLTFDDLSGTFAGIPMRGRIEAALGAPMRIDGRLDADAIDVAALVGTAIGAPGAARADPAPLSSEPFAPGLFDLASGRIQFGAARAVLTPALAIRQARASVRLERGEMALEDIEGELAAGRVAGAVSFRRLAEGLAAHVRLALVDVDAAAVVPGDGRPALSGRLALQVEADGTGLSPATLMGSLAGSGSATLTAGEIAGFDPKAFDVVMRAVDQGMAINGPKFKEVVEAALDRGNLRVARADGALSIAAGQMRLSTTIMRGEGADLTATGSVDLADRHLDARLAFSGGTAEGAGGRPDVHAIVRGPITTARRTIDITALSAWLTLRSVERETRRIDAIEADVRDAAVGATGEPASSPPLAPARPTPAAPRATPVEPSRIRPPAAPAGRPEASALPPATPSPALSSPALPPPIDIRPAQNPAGSTARPRAPGAPNGSGPRRDTQAAPAEAPAPSRSILDRLFGPQR